MTQLIPRNSFTVGIARRIRRRRLVRKPEDQGDPVLRARIDELGPWFHNIDIRGTPTKTRSLMGESLEYPRPMWDSIRPALPDLRGKTVLDIGCNAGFFSIEAKRLAAARVLGIDVNQGHDFVAQARFAAQELGLDIEYRVEDFRDLAGDQFDLVFFLGVLYHLEDPIEGLARVANLSRGTIVVESLVNGRSGAFIEFRRKGFHGDMTTRWIPSATFITERLADVGFGHFRQLGRMAPDRILLTARRP